ncbi:DUF2188 domain-containing protein [Acholeplasma vituli]|uniref:DUF2188 domain-containing protein n=1 Tax=Paracholeplasma vituli TaxID=69473 RepID=A0ABT2PZG3_9MOLU|nr:DUF2188 domain-containing protein [Paracholeplasma vituli]MCU0105739.1 DUF2188 domain-containing protein [Paracholeplasma vituli]
MTEFLRDYGIYVLGGIVILFVIITYFLSRKPEKVEEPAKPTPKPEVVVKPESVEVTDQPVPIAVVEEKPVVPLEKMPEEIDDKVAEQNVEAAWNKVATPSEGTQQPGVDKKPNAKPSPKKETVVKAETVDEVDEDADEEAALKRIVKNPKYHISMNKDEKSPYFKKWRVRKEGSTKTIKYFDTQKEAIDYAQGLAEKASTSVVIHKVDGSIRKQDYSKK